MTTPAADQHGDCGGTFLLLENDYSTYYTMGPGPGLDASLVQHCASTRTSGPITETLSEQNAAPAPGTVYVQLQNRAPVQATVNGGTYSEQNAAPARGTAHVQLQNRTPVQATVNGGIHFEQNAAPAQCTVPGQGHNDAPVQATVNGGIHFEQNATPAQCTVSGQGHNDAPVQVTVNGGTHAEEDTVLARGTVPGQLQDDASVQVTCNRETVTQQNVAPAQKDSLVHPVFSPEEGCVLAAPHPGHMDSPGQEDSSGTEPRTVHLDVTFQDYSAEVETRPAHYSVTVQAATTRTKKLYTYLAIPVDDVIGRMGPRTVHVTITFRNGCLGRPMARSVRQVVFDHPEDSSGDTETSNGYSDEPADDDGGAEPCKMHLDEPAEKDDSGGAEPCTMHLDEPAEKDDSGGAEPCKMHLDEPAEKDDSGGAEPCTMHLDESRGVEDSGGMGLRTVPLSAPDEVTSPTEARSVLIGGPVRDSRLLGNRLVSFSVPKEVSAQTETRPEHSVILFQDEVGGKCTYDLLFPTPMQQGSAETLPQCMQAGAPVQDSAAGDKTDAGEKPRRSVHFPATVEQDATHRQVEDAAGGLEDSIGAVPRSVQAATPSGEDSTVEVPREGQASAAGQEDCVGGERHVNKRKATVPVKRDVAEEQAAAATMVEKDLAFFKCYHCLLVYLCEVCSVEMTLQHRIWCRMMFRKHERQRLNARRERVARLNAQLEKKEKLYNPDD